MARKKPGGGGAVLAGAAVVALFILVANHHHVEDPEDGAHRLRRRVPTTDECRGPRATIADQAAKLPLARPVAVGIAARPTERDDRGRRSLA